ncbi:LLM class flavin-dependent oxidoreductase [Gordonia sp. DT30]|uniref:LLM class flavin-dependent oxidoreductase n=1 Tax=Gordonia sp. DT30 TaxID=3416546 RepID=UPI003CF372A4
MAAREAIRSEEEGWTGILLPDSQNLAAELIVEMTMCAARTEQILISPGVTNSVTRHPAVLAGAMATLQAETGGRAVMEIGRGDSALAHLGFAGMKVAPFCRYITALQTYLSGGEVDFDPSFVPAGQPSISELGLGQEPEASSLRWLRPSQKKVPVGIAATGPRMIQMGATLGDGVSFSVGADPGRIGSAVDIARKARVDAGLDPDTLRMAAFINVAVHDDIDRAAAITAGKLASFSRFSVMNGTVTGVGAGADTAVLEKLHGNYDMVAHGRTDAQHVETLTREFAERNAVIGSPAQCLERLKTLRDLGITRFFFTEDFSREGASGEAHDNLVRHVLPVVNSWS